MESSNTNNKKVDGSMVKELKRKGSTFERGDEAGKLILCKTCGKSYHPNETIPDGKDQQCSDCSELLEPIMNLKKKKAKNSTKMDNKAKTSTQGPKLTQRISLDELTGGPTKSRQELFKVIMVGREIVSSNEFKEAGFRWTRACAVQRIQSRSQKAHEKQDFVQRAKVWSNEQVV